MFLSNKKMSQPISINQSVSNFSINSNNDLHFNSNILVLMTDFGLTDGSVSEVRGLIYSIDPTLNVSDLSHDIPPFSIRHAAYRLFQVAPYWPCGTFFVCVVAICHWWLWSEST
jgi:hypothetical protein